MVLLVSQASLVYQEFLGEMAMPGSHGPTGEKGEPGERGNDCVDLVKSN